MSLFQIKAVIPTAEVDPTSDLLIENGDLAWSISQDVLGNQAWVLGVFADGAEAETAWANVKVLLPWAGEGRLSELADEDWKESYKAHFKAWQCGRVHWVPVWERGEHVLPAGDVAIWLDPGMAFGTGNHETTRLCCERLVAWAETAPRSARVIDAGCGSGILAISAARLGFERVTGFDNDREAVAVSRENAVLNGLGESVSFTMGDLVTGWGGQRGDLVIANIQSDVLIRYAPELLAAVMPHGELVLSGILAIEKEAVQKAFERELPAAKIHGRVLGEWSDLLIKCPG